MFFKFIISVSTGSPQSPKSPSNANETDGQTPRRPNNCQ